MDLDDIRSGESKRGSCPKCHRHNTFTLSREGNTIKWNCYSASCNYRGVKHNSSMSLEDIKFNHEQKNKMKGTQKFSLSTPPQESFRGYAAAFAFLALLYTSSRERIAS